MGVTPHRREGATGKKFLAAPSSLSLYVAVVVVLGFASILFVCLFSPWSSTFNQALAGATIFLAVAAITGELKPILLTRSGARVRTLSTSAPFVLALIPVAGVGVALLVQVIASFADDLIHRRQLQKSLFNTAQYSLSVLAGGAVYSLLTNVPLFGVPMSVDTADIVPLLIAGAAMIGVNWFVVAGVVSLATGHPFWAVLRQDLREFMVTLVVLLSVGGIAAIVASDGVGALALLVAPVVAAHLFAAAAARHAHAATHDALTGLGNRGQLDRELKNALTNTPNYGEEGPGLVLLDLDHFKDFNDTLGHPVGDTILCEVADRLVAASPESASVHRLGGDEFAVVVHGGLEDARKVASDLLSSIDSPIEVENLGLLVRASVGVAVAPGHGTDAATLLKNSDIALYHAKLERDRISTFSPEFNVNTLERLRLLADLRKALDSRMLTVKYQPQIDLTTHLTVGVEALVRWNHPERGNVPPEEFIPLAENSGLIFPLTAFVLDTALAQLAQWRSSGHDIRMAVNLSARHLSDLALPGQVADAAAEHGVPLTSLVLEVTETGILSDPVRADVVIQALREVGVSIAIDDYGTGNASLSYLKRLEIDELKIDKSFIGNIGADHHDLIIVRSTIGLALALGLRVVAEGIEDESTAAALRELGTVVGQGYHIGYAEQPDVIEARLQAERANAPQTGR